MNLKINSFPFVLFYRTLEIKDQQRSQYDTLRQTSSSDDTTPSYIRRANVDIEDAPPTLFIENIKETIVLSLKVLAMEAIKNYSRLSNTLLSSRNMPSDVSLGTMTSLDEMIVQQEKETNGDSRSTTPAVTSSLSGERGQDPVRAFRDLVLRLAKEFNQPETPSSSSCSTPVELLEAISEERASSSFGKRGKDRNLSNSTIARTRRK